MSCQVASKSRAKLFRQAIGSRHPPFGLVLDAEWLPLILDGSYLLATRKGWVISEGRTHC
jgi:hypothetical protein